VPTRVPAVVMFTVYSHERVASLKLGGETIRTKEVASDMRQYIGRPIGEVREMVCVE